MSNIHEEKRNWQFYINLELIGEAATHIPNDVRKVHLEIEVRCNCC